MYLPTTIYLPDGTFGNSDQSILVRVTIDKSIGIKSKKREVVRPIDDFRAPESLALIFSNVCETDSEISFDTTCAKGKVLFVLPSREDMRDEVKARVKLPYDYFPCPLESEYTNGAGVVTISKETLNIVDFEILHKGLGFELTSEVVDETDTTIKLTCIFANGGANITNAIL